VRDTRGVDKKLSVLVSAGFQWVSPRIWSSTSMDKVMGCRAHTAAQRQSNQQRSKPTKIKTNKDQRWTMLGAHPIYPVLLSTDLAATKEFYHDRLGLEILNENEEALTFGCGAGTQFSVTKSTVGTADSQTQVSWEVSDVRAEVTELRSRGVKVEDYDLPGLKTDDGIADLGFAWAAWIIDPGKNALGILQLKD
jgi:catechol 2,3-dioxygenase-like lactoylglutathione lyase family enzyme